MAVLSYNEITKKKFIMYEGQPYEVLSSHVFRMQQRKPVNQTKLRHLITKKVAEISFHQNETVQEANLEHRVVTYLYANRGEAWFCEKGQPSQRFSLDEGVVGDALQFLKQNTDVEAVVLDDEIVGMTPPIKVDLKVKEAPPAVKGNTAQGGDKVVVLETGASVTTPMFINEGDIIRINTETGEYVERVEKS
jgi:elongation factor P